MAKWSGVKRFYKKADIIKGLDGLFLIVLDNNLVKTPSGSELSVPSLALAKAMAGEWNAQGETIDPNTMPLCKLSATAIDRIKNKRDEVIGITLKIVETDLLCYRAKDPVDLVSLQDVSWQSELDWAKQEFKVDLNVTTEILPVIQPEASLVILRGVLMALNDYMLMGVTNAAAAAGSLILSLSMLRGRLDAKTMFEKSILEEKFQMDKWGWDEETIERHKIIQHDIKISEQFLNLLEK